MSMSIWLAIAGGAIIGAWLRHALNLLLNPLGSVPFGTLTANLVGGALAGVVLAMIARGVTWSPETRLFITTGLLGGLTTFSAFSAETVNLMLRGAYGWAAANIAANLGGSLAMTLFGFYLVKGLR